MCLIRNEEGVRAFSFIIIPPANDWLCVCCVYYKILLASHPSSVSRRICTQSLLISTFLLFKKKVDVFFISKTQLLSVENMQRKWEIFYLGKKANIAIT
jgi:hypothetical protein